MNTHRLALTVTVLTLIVTACASPTLAMYNPRIGRFMQRDPIGTATGPVVARTHGPQAPSRVGAAGTINGSQFIARDAMPNRPTAAMQYADGMSTYEYVNSQPNRYRDATGLTISHQKFKTDKKITGYYYFCRPVAPFAAPIFDILQQISPRYRRLHPTHCFIAMKCCHNDTWTTKYWSSFPDRTGHIDIPIFGRNIRVPYLINTYSTNDPRDMNRNGLGEKLQDCDWKGAFGIGTYVSATKMDVAVGILNNQRIPYLWLILNSNDTVSYAWYKATGGTVTSPPGPDPGTNFLAALDQLGIIGNN